MSALDDLRGLLPVRAFRRLLTVRLLSQASDGVVQVALATYLFFSPERQTTPGAIAVVTAATLLPFTIVGPFTGLVLDRWSRRDVLVGATLVRALLAVTLAAVLATRGPDPVLYVVVVVGFGINRFLLAGLSAALPHTVDTGSLLAANAIVPTTGTLAYVAGLGVGGLVQTVRGDSLVVLVAAAGWVGAAAAGWGFARPSLGPDRGADRGPAPSSPGTLRLVLVGLLGASRHLRERPSVARAIGVVAVQRLCAALALTAGILLYRSSYASADDPRAGLAGLSVATLAAGIGFVAAAGLTPVLVARWSTRVTVCCGLSVGALAQAVFAATLAEAALVGAAFALSLGGQVIKICADTEVQRGVDDVFRGRVFLLYDMAFNTALVSAACLGAVLLPPSGRSPGVMAAAAAVLLLATGLTAPADAGSRSR